MSLPRKRTKYGAVKTTVDGITFDSKREANRWCELKLLERAGKITNLARQVEYPLWASNQKLVGCYIADFAYTENGSLVVEDVKSPATAKNALYVWKKRHLQKQDGIEIREV